MDNVNSSEYLTPFLPQFSRSSPQVPSVMPDGAVALRSDDKTWELRSVVLVVDALMDYVSLLDYSMGGAAQQAGLIGML
jgi:hypothetical protein